MQLAQRGCGFQRSQDVFPFFDSAICAPVDKASTYSSRKVASLVAVKAIQFIDLSDPIAASLSWKTKRGSSKRNGGGGGG